MRRLAGNRILVTGAASGIGQATALRLVDEGAAVVAADIAADGLDKTRAQAQEAGGGERLTTLGMNIGDERSVVDGVRSAVDTLGGLDSVVNAAGILRAVHTEQMGLDLWNQIIGVNLTGTFLVVRETLPALLQNPRSAIVNFSSTSASFAHPYMAAYAASKGGVQSFTHALALEYASKGLRAVCVAPGSIKSGITDATGGYIPQDADWGLFTRLMPIMPTTEESSGAGMAAPSAVAGGIGMLVSDDGALITALDAVVRFVDALSLETVDIVGNSMGGGVAINFAIAHPDRARRLVTIGGIGRNILSPGPAEGIRLLQECTEEPTRERLIRWLHSMVYDPAIVTEELIEERWSHATDPQTLAGAGRMYSKKAFTQMR